MEVDEQKRSTWPASCALRTQKPRTLLPAGGAGRFLSACGNLDRATIAGARGWAILFALDLVAIGNAGVRGLPGGTPARLPAGRGALDRALDRPIRA